ncbi:Probable oxidoreductase [Mycobacteroides abscessus subsp. abscessus]|nr:Probable oxidoreductase [Mycobacteroides abscessus subsp. abscessus]
MTRPALGRGALKSGKALADIQIHHSPMIIIGRDDAELASARAAVRKQLAFYGSTPAYWPILELHGRAEMGPKLKERSKQGEWESMAALVDDDFVDTAAVTVTDPGQGARELRDRYGDLVRRLGFNTPYRPDRALLAELLAAFPSR